MILSPDARIVKLTQMFSKRVLPWTVSCYEGDRK